jgi:hypothetical protein
MFAQAIERVSQFTRPIHLITRNFGSNTVIPGAATLFFVNKEGWALTCGHVVDLIVSMNQINENYGNYRAELAGLKNANRDARRHLEKKYNFNSKTTCQVKARFIGCMAGTGAFQLDFRRHPKLDVALVRVSPPAAMQSYPKFAVKGSQLKQGKYLCRLGFPFPEFSNFAYNSSTDEIDWTTSGQENSPQFPIEGMVTRHMIDAGDIVAFEMSTPGLRGQSGGPAFDVDGLVWGMQSQTRHLDLDFDVDQEVFRQGVPDRRRDSAFLHVGVCAHVEVLKSFMLSSDVSFEAA